MMLSPMNIFLFRKICYFVFINSQEFLRYLEYLSFAFIRWSLFGGQLLITVILFRFVDRKRSFKINDYLKLKLTYKIFP